jgi:small-conductance mechanosensitive channel/CRP-like cAMP-binding protein
MEFINNLTGSFFWSAILSLVLFLTVSMAIGFFAKKSPQLKPIGTGLKLVLLFIAIQLFLSLGGAEYYPYLALYLKFISWLILTFAAVRLILYIYGDLFVVRWKKGSFPAAFKNIITVSVIVVAVLFLLKGILDINVTSLIATTTVLTATIGLAFQGTLANMLAGLTIHLEKPLKQGDWISVAGYEGRVTDITLRSTRIMTLDHNEVFIPNSKVLNEAVLNYSLPDADQMRKISFGVSYDIPPNKVKDVMLHVLASVPGVSGNLAPTVRVTNYADFSVHYEVRYAISDFSESIEIDARIMNLLWYQFKREGIDIPMPVRNINVRQTTPESLKLECEQQSADILARMEKVDILSPLSKAELKKLVSRLSIKTFAAGEVPVHQGDAGDSFYIIKSGKVDVIVEKVPGESAVVATLGPGNFFGEISLLTGATRTASIHVKEDAEFIVIDKESFTSTLVNNPSIAESLSHILSERQVGLDAEREKLDAAARARRKKDVSSKLLSKISEFFGLNL